MAPILTLFDAQCTAAGRDPRQVEAEGMVLESQIAQLQINLRNWPGPFEGEAYDQFAGEIESRLAELDQQLAELPGFEQVAYYDASYLD